MRGTPACWQSWWKARLPFARVERCPDVHLEHERPPGGTSLALDAKRVTRQFVSSVSAWKERAATRNSAAALVDWCTVER